MEEVSGVLVRVMIEILHDPTTHHEEYKNIPYLNPEEPTILRTYIRKS